MTGPEARQIGVGWALEDFGARLAEWGVDDQPVDFDVDDLAVYEKPTS